MGEFCVVARLVLPHMTTSGSLRCATLTDPTALATFPAFQVEVIVPACILLAHALSYSGSGPLEEVRGSPRKPIQ